MAKTIMIVDDSAFMRNILRRIINKVTSNVKIIEAKDAKEAVEKYNAEKPDLVLLDIILPGDDGIAALKQMKGATVIMVTALGQEATFEDAKNLGAKEYITKPFDEAKVASTIKRYLM